MARTPAEQKIYDLVRAKVEKSLNSVLNAFGPRLTREELGALMDGAQDAVMEWTPPGKKAEPDPWVISPLGTIRGDGEVAP